MLHLTMGEGSLHCSLKHLELGTASRHNIEWDGPRVLVPQIQVSGFLWEDQDITQVFQMPEAWERSMNGSL